MALNYVHISGKSFVFLLVFVITISGLVFGMAMIGPDEPYLSTDQSYPTYFYDSDTELVAATMTSFTAHVSNGYNGPKATTSSGSKTRTSSSSKSSGTIRTGGNQQISSIVSYNYLQSKTTNPTHPYMP